MLSVEVYYSFVDFLLMFLFFKQKTAYEMRISDWSSDVCSSDLTEQAFRWSAGVDQRQYRRSRAGARHSSGTSLFSRRARRDHARCARWTCQANDDSRCRDGSYSAAMNTSSAAGSAVDSAAVEAYLRGLQQRICDAVETLEGDSGERFVADAWPKPPDSRSEEHTS